MSLRLGALQDALESAGVKPELAQKAAEEGAEYEGRFSSLETKITALRGEMVLLRWMVGVNIALTLIILGRLLVVPS